MKITIGGKKVSANTMLDEGRYNGSVESVRAGREDEKAKIGSEFFSTAVIRVKIEHNGETQQKEKKIIITERKDTELADLLQEFSHLADEDGITDLMDLVGEECEVEIVNNTSQKGNLFANVGEIKKR